MLNHSTVYSIYSSNKSQLTDHGMIIISQFKGIWPDDTSYIREIKSKVRLLNPTSVA